MAKSDSTQLSPWAKDERGNIYGRLTVVELSFVKAEVHWLCECECGNQTTVSGSHLRKGDVKSCGCLRSSQGGAYKTPEYNSWREVKSRCYNPNDTGYHWYGGRGIGMCVRWHESFQEFLSDMGEKPSPEHSIERIDNDGDYEPSNCRWATTLEQGQNTRKTRLLTCNGETHGLREWARRLGVVHRTIARRLEQGWSMGQIVDHYST